MTSVIMKCDSQEEGMAHLKDVIHIIIYTDRAAADGRRS